MTSEAIIVEPTVAWASSGGVPARRAVARWAWRLFRREWRQQALVLALLATTVAVAIGLMSAAYTMAPVPGNADFGSARLYVAIEDPDPLAVQASITAARDLLGTIDVIGHRDVPVAGVFRPVDLRTQDPTGPYSGPLLGLRQGAYPSGPNQIAVTDGVAATLQTRVGAQVEFGGATRTVVGIVENPSDLGDEFALAAPGTVQLESVRVLVNADDEQLRSFRPPATSIEVGGRAAGEDLIAGLIVLMLATVVLLLAALVSAASFVVMAHRRARQLGMLAAIGATEKQLRNVTVVNGAVIGAAAALVGAAVGIVGWTVTAPRLEALVDFRIDAFNLPLPLIAAAMVLTVLTATAAAWWPARAVARMPTVLALSGRPPQPRPARRSATLAVLAGGAGLACLAIGGDVGGSAAGGGLRWLNAVLLVTGTVALILGMLLAGPIAIRVLGMVSGRLPVAIRLAFADLSRYRARSGAALAAISLVLGIAVTTIVTTTSQQQTGLASNLSDQQVMVRVADMMSPFAPDQAEIDRLRPQVDRLAAALPGATVTPLTAAFDPRSEQDPKLQGRFVISIARRSGDGWSDVSQMYMATPQLLGLYGRQPGEPSTAFLTRESGDLRILGVGVGVGQSPETQRTEPERMTDLTRLPDNYTSLPGTFVTPQEMRARNWIEVPSGIWLIETSAPPAENQLAAAQAIAAEVGLTIEVRDQQRSLAAVRTGAMLAGMLVALGILAMTVGLVRSETGRDLRVLTATGARRKTRRTITAATAGGLAVLAVVLGTATAYLGLIAGFLHNLDMLDRIPVLQLTVIAVGVPLVATVGGWLVSGREPAYLARQPME